MRSRQRFIIKMSIVNKVVLITGASSGIGAGTAIHFSKLGAKLAIVGRNLKNLEEVAGKCKSPVKIIQADLNDVEDMKNVVQTTISTYGKLDILINNAGVLQTGTIETTTLEQYDKVMNTNVRSVFHLTHLAVPYLIESKGTVVNVSSVNGLRSFAGVLAYNMSKSAVDQFTRCVALELAGKGVRVNSVNPGVVRTEIHRTAGMGEQEYAAFLERVKTTHALGRPGEVDEIAKAIELLAGDSSSFITGANLPVDGGRHAMCPR